MSKSPSALRPKLVLFCAFAMISASTREVDDCSFFSEELFFCASLRALLVGCESSCSEYFRSSFGESGIVFTSLPAWYLIGVHFCR